MCFHGTLVMQIDFSYLLVIGLLEVAEYRFEMIGFFG